MADVDKDREQFLKEAGRLYDEMISRAGLTSGDTFDDIEIQAEGAGRQLILKLIKERLAAEEKGQPQEVLCPNCQKPMRRPAKPSARQLDTASGVVDYTRQHAICDCCDESFSPSGSAAEDSPPRVERPADAKGL